MSSILNENTTIRLWIFPCLSEGRLRRSFQQTLQLQSLLTSDR
jgi:hypothetical protein